MKDALIVESRKPTLPENSVKISSIKYWNILTELFEQHSEALWYDVSQMELDKLWLGLKEIPYEDNLGSYFDSHRFFEVVDKQKYLWAKIKYGI
jgi:hypothetical protein